MTFRRQGLLLLRIGSVCWFTAVATFAVAASRDPGVADFYVSTLGNDHWSGKLADPGEKDGPFATVARARDAVGALLKTNREPRPIRVVLRGGTYYLESTLQLGPEDSGTEQAPVVYRAASGEGSPQGDLHAGSRVRTVR